MKSKATIASPLSALHMKASDSRKIQVIETVSKKGSNCVGIVRTVDGLCQTVCLVNLRTRLTYCWVSR